MSDIKTARFDTRWTIEQKEMFEHASLIGGYRSLSDFVFYTLKEKSEELIKDDTKFLKSERDRNLFFSTLLNPQKPNSKLVAAVTKYQKT